MAIFGWTALGFASFFTFLGLGFTLGCLASRAAALREANEFLHKIPRSVGFDITLQPRSEETGAFPVPREFPGALTPSRMDPMAMLRTIYLMKLLQRPLLQQGVPGQKNAESHVSDDRVKPYDTPNGQVSGCLAESVTAAGEQRTDN
jgi:hypothetical protein